MLPATSFAITLAFVPTASQTWKQKYCRPETCLRRPQPVSETETVIPTPTLPGVWSILTPYCPATAPNNSSRSPCRRTHLLPHQLPAAAGPKTQPRSITRASQGSTAPNLQAMHRPQLQIAKRQQEQQMKVQHQYHLPKSTTMTATKMQSSRSRLRVRVRRSGPFLSSSRVHRAGTGSMCSSSGSVWWRWRVRSSLLS